MNTPRVVTLDTIDRGLVTVDEPAWCIGHGWQRDIGRNDITHNSVRAKSWVDTETYGREPLLTTRVTWAPFVELVPVVTVEMDVIGDYSAEDALKVARGLRIAACRLERVAAEAIRLREGVL
ncbi:DUF6907 domain-containing protein [Streptomyces europaeiscabiei]|uniref:DUF6907 domain-containing protein n=1 Tax=Streptomyces europaeiscabiei TaxID=146819 RepID=UPI000765BC37|nr:hypothetical protein [Streptomyces europaeiscabiei]